MPRGHDCPADVLIERLIFLGRIREARRADGDRLHGHLLALRVDVAGATCRGGLVEDRVRRRVLPLVTGHATGELPRALVSKLEHCEIVITTGHMSSSEL